jgi:hypothetical protein
MGGNDPMSTIDPFGRTDTLDQITLEALVLRFEARGKHPLFTKMLHDYLNAMQVEDCALILDPGSQAHQDNAAYDFYATFRKEVHLIRRLS